MALKLRVPVFDIIGLAVPLTLLRGDGETLPVLDSDDDTLGEIDELNVKPMDVLNREDIDSNTDRDADELLET